MQFLNGYVQILGVQSYESKDKAGNPVTNNILHYCEDFNEYDLNHGAMGMKCSSEFTREDIPMTLKPGDICRLFYTKGFKDMAVLSGLQIIESKKANVNVPERKAETKA